MGLKYAQRRVGLMHAYASSENKCKYMLKNAGTEVPKVQKQGNITATKQEIWMHQ